MIFHVPNILSAEQVRAICAELQSGAFVDGKQTGGETVRDVKHNREIGVGSEVAARLDTEIQQALKANHQFRLVAMPHRVAPFIFSSYVLGHTYGDHTDNPLMGGGGQTLRSDLAMTLFLSDPADYDGGELVLDTDLMPTSWKLPPGDAVVYPAYSLHRVEPVTRGERRAAITWIQSQIRQPERRQVIIDLVLALSGLRQTAPGGQSNPEIRRLGKAIGNLSRIWSEV